MYYSQVTYKMFNHDNGRSITLETDPINWDAADKKLIRSKKTFGVVTELSKDLEFTKDGKDFLDAAFTLMGVEADVTLEEWRNYPDKDGQYLHSTGSFDFIDYKSEKLKTKVPFTTGGLNTRIKAQLKEKFDIDKTESLKGDALSEVSKVTTDLTERKILLVSRLETSDIDRESTSFRMNFTNGNYRTASLGIPTTAVVNSDQDHIQSVFKDSSFITTPNDGEALSMFYLNNDRTKNLKLSFDVYFKIKEIKVDDLSNEFLKVDLVRFSGGNSLNIHTRETLFNISMSNINGRVVSFTATKTITLEQGESLSLQWYGGGNFGGFLNDGDLKVDFQDTKAVINIVEDSEYDDSQAKAVRFHEIGEKLTKILSGNFYSRFYGRTDLGYSDTGEFANTALSLGFWIRQFNDKKLEISLDDFLMTSKTIHNTGWGIEEIEGVETLVVEDLKYFFQETTAIRLGKVSDVKREVAKEFYHSNVEVGYKKPDGDNLYEEAMGLDEYNGNRGYTEPITRSDKKLSLLSPARADRYGIEFARRKPESLFPEQDTRYDQNPFVLDLKEEVTGKFTERKWQDDYELEPTGVYSPETATNLRITPRRNLERHGWFFGAGLQRYQTDKVRFSNSTLNSELTTKKTGEDAKAENGDLLISDLDRPRFVPMWITFNNKVDFEVNQMVYGKTKIGDREIPNFYFLVEFINEYNQKEHGYLFDLQPNKEGKWKLLKANS